MAASPLQSRENTIKLCREISRGTSPQRQIRSSCIVANTSPKDSFSYKVVQHKSPYPYTLTHMKQPLILFYNKKQSHLFYKAVQCSFDYQNLLYTFLRHGQLLLALAHSSSWIIPQCFKAAHAVACYKMGFTSISFPGSAFLVGSFQLQSLGSL